MATTRKVTTVHAGGRMYFKDATSGTPETTIVEGDSVEWSAPDTDHSVISDNVAPFDTLSPPLNDDVDQNDTFTRQFTTAGKFGYHCGVHGGNPVTEKDMYGIITVTAAKP